MKRKTQIENVYLRLVSGATITPLQAFHWFGSLRLGSIIHKLRKEGMDIKTTMIKVGENKWIARYSL